MDSSVFWSTFWGGLASLAAFGVLSASAVWLMARLVARFRKRPHWRIETSRNGVVSLTYERRKPVATCTIVYYKDGAYVDHSRVEPHPNAYSVFQNIKPGLPLVLPGGFEWDEIGLEWVEGHVMGAEAHAPQRKQQAEVFASTLGKSSLRQRLGLWLAKK